MFEEVCDAAEEYEVEMESVSVMLDVSSSCGAVDGIGSAVVVAWAECLAEVVSSALGLRSSSWISVNGVSGVWHPLLATAPTEFLSHADTVGVVVKQDV